MTAKKAKKKARKKTKKKKKAKKKSGKKKKGKKKGKKSNASFYATQATAEGHADLYADPALAEVSKKKKSKGKKKKKAKKSSAAKISLRVLAADVQGSIEGLQDSAGKVAAGDLYDLDPYGALENESSLSKEAKTNEVRFQGFSYDSASELYDMQARSYRPQVARFMSRDRYESSELDFTATHDP